MMAPKVRNMFSAAKADKSFRDELKAHEPEAYKPGLFWSDEKKIMYSCIYMGWLIAKGNYDESLFS